MQADVGSSATLQAHRCCMALQQCAWHGVTVALWGAVWHGTGAQQLAVRGVGFGTALPGVACGLVSQQVLQGTVWKGCRVCMALQRDALGPSRRHGLNMC